MDDLPDYDLHRTPGESTVAPARPRAASAGVWVAAALLIAAAGVAIYLAFGWRPAQAPPAAARPAAAPATESLPPLGGTADAVTIPPLDASDTVVRSLVQALSDSPAVVAWLPTKGLIRNFTLVVANIGDGATPAKHLKSLQPSSAFRVVERDGNTYVDPRSYDRYNVIADAVASIDPAAAAKLYATLKPRIEEAHRDLGGQNASFDRTLTRAIVALLETPIVDNPPRLRPKGIGYAYADDRLEELTAAQRQLLRMGPRNVRVIKARLREIAQALGIPPAQLPAR
jgi:Protein of unknown function (DUF3014)